MKPITIIVTSNGNGYIYCNKRIEDYSYDEIAGLQKLVEFGAIPANMVKIYTLEEAVATLGEMAEKED